MAGGWFGRLVESKSLPNDVEMALRITAKFVARWRFLKFGGLEQPSGSSQQNRSSMSRADYLSQYHNC